MVLGRAVFASCPSGSSASCASNPTSLSVEDGGDVSFDATVIHTPGGSCGFRQEITHVRLKKLNPSFGIADDLLLSCDTSSGQTCGNSRVSLNRGNDPGYEFVFTLTGANVYDFGMYKVEVEVVHPRTNLDNKIIKIFYLDINATEACFRPLTNRKIFRFTTIVTMKVNSSKVESDTEQCSSNIEQCSSDTGQCNSDILHVEQCSSAAVLQAVCHSVGFISSKHTSYMRLMQS